MSPRPVALAVTATALFILFLSGPPASSTVEGVEAHSATNSQRAAFMDIRGYSLWNDSDVAWNDRGIEGAAFIIQQTIGGLPLPYTLNREFWERSAAFEALTGQRDLRLPDESHQPDPQ